MLSVAAVRERLLEEAQALADDDIQLNKRMASIGNEVVLQNANILTYVPYSIPCYLIFI